MTLRALLLPLALAGCSSTATRFWTVEPVGGVAPAAAVANIAPIQITAVHVPLAIDRLEVVRHDAADRVKVLDFDRWSAPPGDLLRRALTQDLVAQLPPGSVVFPDSPAPAATRRIVVDVLDLRQTGDRYAIQLSWAMTTPNGPPHQLRLEAPLGEGDVAAQTDALGSMMAQLAGDMASTLTVAKPR